jgi:hypothetical protein
MLGRMAKVMLYIYLFVNVNIHVLVLVYEHGRKPLRGACILCPFRAIIKPPAMPVGMTFPKYLKINPSHYKPN